MTLPIMRINILPATEKDIAQIQAIVAQSWPATYGKILSPEQLTYMVDLFYSDQSLKKQFSEGHQFYILSEGQDAIGFMDIEKINAAYCKLHKIYLLPAHQGKGYGKALLDYAIHKARQMEATQLKLNVNRHNKALGFYQRLGFKIAQQVDNPIGQGYYMNDYVMELSL